MKTISKLSDKCKKCSYSNECKDKRMVLCAMKEWKPSASDAINSMVAPFSQPVIRVEHPVTINMKEYGTINTSLEEITENLKRDFYKYLNCSFNR